MASLDPDSFKRALKRFTSSLDPALQQQFSTCTLQHVHETIRDIQNEQLGGKKLRAMNRLQGFIEAMEQLSKVIEIFLNVSEFVCFIWGPIKFLLTVTRTYLEIFDRLLDAYSQIGEAIPGLLHYQATFERHPPLAAVLEDYYSDVLNFHTEAILVFARPTWRRVFSATWKTFETRFDPILQSLTRRRQLLESEKISASLDTIQTIREEIATIHKQQQVKTATEDLERHRLRIREIKDKLESPNYEFDQEVSTENRNGSRSGQWIFCDPTFQSWLNNDFPSHKVLYINGIPGAGKTTLISTVIEKLLHEKRAPDGQCFVGYFYFKHGQNNTHNSLLRALFEQLLNQNPALSSHISDEVSLLEGVNLRTTEKLGTLVKASLESYKLACIVLDGLDECAKGETEKTVKWFMSLIDIVSQNTDRSLRIIFSGQRDGVLDKELIQQPAISLETSAHVEDIHHYCQGICKRITTKFFPSSPKEGHEMEKEILTLVTSEAKGMFLYARVVLENLLSQTRLSRLRREIQGDIFPRGLENAYNRVVARILEDSSPAEREDAIKMLGLVVHAKRILYWREVQAFFCIDPVEGKIDYEERLLVSSKDLCGSLLDTHQASSDNTGSESSVRIVHETARKYLFAKQPFDLGSEGLKLSIFCCRYLTSQPFVPGIDAHNVESHAKKGYYALQDYAVQSWYDHARASVVQSSDASNNAQFSQAIDALHDFLNSYGLQSKMGEKCVANKHSKVIEKLNRLPTNGRDRNAFLNVELRTTLIRQQIEIFQTNATTDGTQEDTFSFFHGPKRIVKCSKPWCDFFMLGFDTMEERQRHVGRHDLPFTCNLENCPAARIGYDSQSALDDHRKIWHGATSEPIRFPKPRQKKYRTIWSAIEDGDLEAVAYFLSTSLPSIHQSHHGGFNPLGLAAKFGHFDICRLLLSHGAGVIYSKESKTALYQSVANGHLEVVRLLVPYTMYTMRTLHVGLQALADIFGAACHSGHEDIAIFLIESEQFRGFLSNSFNMRSELLQSAIVSGNPAVVKLLLKVGCDDVVSMGMVRLVMQNYKGAGSEQIIEMLFSTGKPKSRNEDWIIDYLDPHRVPAAKLILSYPNLWLSMFALETIRVKARKMGWRDVSNIIKGIEGHEYPTSFGGEILGPPSLDIREDFVVISP